MKIAIGDRPIEAPSSMVETTGYPRRGFRIDLRVSPPWFRSAPVRDDDANDTDRWCDCIHAGVV